MKIEIKPNFEEMLISLSESEQSLFLEILSFYQKNIKNYGYDERSKQCIDFLFEINRKICDAGFDTVLNSINKNREK